MAKKKKAAEKMSAEKKAELRNAKIEIIGNNFYFQTALPKDEQLKENYIGADIKELPKATLPHLNLQRK